MGKYSYPEYQTKWREKNRLKCRKYQRDWWRKHREERLRKLKLRRHHDPRVLKKEQEYRAKNKDRMREYSKAWYQKNKWRKKGYSVRWQDKAKAECFKAYGDKCNCCGETRPEFLTVHHVNGRKNSPHRKRLTGYALYSWLRSQGFPKDEYRLECFNCNCCRGFRGYCPHDKEREALLGMAAD